MGFFGSIKDYANSAIDKVNAGIDNYTDKVAESFFNFMFSKGVTEDEFNRLDLDTQVKYYDEFGALSASEKWQYSAFDSNNKDFQQPATYYYIKEED